MRFRMMGLLVFLFLPLVALAQEQTQMPTDEPTLASIAPTPADAQMNIFTETDVTVGEYHLPGTLTMPKGIGLFPAVVLIAGSGATDRDETIGPNKPFRDIAEGLAAQGIASLRFDKRTLVLGNNPQLDIAHLTVEQEYIDDSVTAVELLRTTPGIDPAHVFALGHSLGGYVLPRIAQADPHIAGMIIASGLANPLPETILRQVSYQMSLGTPPPNADQILQTYQDLIQQINALTPDSPTTMLVLGAAPAYWLDLKGYDPVALAATLPQPILVLQGERDYQVTMADDFSRWQAGLAHHPDTTFKTYPDLNHIYVTGTGMSTPDEYHHRGNVAPEVVRDIAAWIKAH